MRTNNSNKLSKYLAGTFAIVAGTASADIVYVDIDPDHEVMQFHNTQVDEYYDIIIGGDTVMQIGNWHGYWTVSTAGSNGTFNGIWAIGAGNSSLNSSSANAIIQSGSYNGDPLADTINVSDVINSSANFSSWGYLGIYSVWGSGSGGFGVVGNFNNTIDKFVGTRFNINGSLHYGWLRFDVSNFSSSFSFKDYAYNDVAGDSINAGFAGNLEMVTNLNAVDIANIGNGTDMQITFDKLADESNVEMYHAIVVKASNPNISLDSIMNLDTLESIEIPVTGNNLSTTMYSSSLDSDGDTILENVAYKVFVAVQAKEGEPVYWWHSVSAPSTEVTLESNTSINENFDEIETIESYGDILKINSDNIENLSFEIISIDGKIIKSELLFNKLNIINVSNIESGIYVVRVKNSSGFTTKKIVL